ncbi:MAG: hypothetical protein GFH25_541324n43 [Chloroflexi bacterium AL-N10]|nr:hypothetical protein [Chloroflexi bacterium AL-N10]
MTEPAQILLVVQPSAETRKSPGNPYGFDLIEGIGWTELLEHRPANESP